MQLKNGVLVRHKSNNQKMVVIKVPDNYDYSPILCRFFNKASGKYEVEEFRHFELTELAGRTE